MKNILLSLSVLFVFFPLYSQDNINYRKVLGEGEISVMTEQEKIIERRQPTLHVSIMYETKYYENPEKGGYSLILAFESKNRKAQIPLNGKLLLKTVSGSVISLSESVNGNIVAYKPNTGLLSPISREDDSYYDELLHEIYYYKRGKYPISENELKQLVSEGVIKIRLETTEGALECSYPSTETIRVGLKKREGNLFSMSVAPLFDDLVQNIDLKTSF